MSDAVNRLAVGLGIQRATTIKDAATIVKDAVKRSAALALLTCAFVACKAAQPTNDPPQSTTPSPPAATHETRQTNIATPVSIPTEQAAADNATSEPAPQDKPAATSSPPPHPGANAQRESDSRPAPIGKQAQQKGAVKGPAQTGEGFRAYLQVQPPLKQGGTANVEVVLEPQAPFKCNEQYPYRFYAIEGQGVSPSTSEVRTAQVDPKRTIVPVPVTLERAGPSTLSGTFAFSVCTEEKCLIEKAALSVAFEVEP